VCRPESAFRASWLPKEVREENSIARETFWKILVSNRKRLTHENEIRSFPVEYLYHRGMQRCFWSISLSRSGAGNIADARDTIYS
jgi:hypothetical protein